MMSGSGDAVNDVIWKPVPPDTVIAVPVALAVDAFASVTVKVGV
jgi:hypothetical protein